MTSYMSKRDTPLLAGDVQCILGLSGDDYWAALHGGRLRRSIASPNDPTGRLAFHSFWDLLEFDLSTQLTQLGMVPDAAAGFAAECCDDLALDDRDLVVITGDAELDYASARRSWIDDAAAAASPASLMDWCARLLVQVGHHLHAIAETKALEPSDLPVEGPWAPARGSAVAAVTGRDEVWEPLWEMPRAA